MDPNVAIVVERLTQDVIDMSDRVLQMPHEYHTCGSVTKIAEDLTELGKTIAELSRRPQCQTLDVLFAKHVWQSTVLKLKFLRESGALVRAPTGYIWSQGRHSYRN